MTKTIIMFWAMYRNYGSFLATDTRMFEKMKSCRAKPTIVEDHNCDLRIKTTGM